MKVNRNTAILCLFVILIILPFLSISTNEVVINISIGIFSSAAVACIVALVSYTNEKEKHLLKVYDYLSTVYLNLIILRDRTGSLLTNNNLDSTTLDYELKILISIAETMKIAGDSIKKSEYYGLIKENSLIKRKLQDMDIFRRKIVALYSHISQLAITNLESSNLLLQIELNKTKGVEPDAIIKEKCAEYNKAILVKIAKIHEFEASLCIEADDIATKLNEQYTFYPKWTGKKVQLENEALDILKNR